MVDEEKQKAEHAVTLEVRRVNVRVPVLMKKLEHRKETGTAFLVALSAEEHRVLSAITSGLMNDSQRDRSRLVSLEVQAIRWMIEQVRQQLFPGTPTPTDTRGAR